MQLHLAITQIVPVGGTVRRQPLRILGCPGTSEGRSDAGSPAALATPGGREGSRHFTPGEYGLQRSGWPRIHP
jgi:hypothetical protein